MVIQDDGRLAIVKARNDFRARCDFHARVPEETNGTQRSGRVTKRSEQWVIQPDVAQSAAAVRQAIG
jgi:hypothetical protein